MLGKSRRRDPTAQSRVDGLYIRTGLHEGFLFEFGCRWFWYKEAGLLGQPHVLDVRLKRCQGYRTQLLPKRFRFCWNTPFPLLSVAGP